jgi:hypothetical protein
MSGFQGHKKTRFRSMKRLNPSVRRLGLPALPANPKMIGAWEGQFEAEKTQPKDFCSTHKNQLESSRTNTKLVRPWCSLAFPPKKGELRLPFFAD